MNRIGKRRGGIRELDPQRSLKRHQLITRVRRDSIECITTLHLDSETSQREKKKRGASSP